MDCSTLPLIRTLYSWVLSKEVSSTIFKVFGITRPGIELRSPGPLANTLPTKILYFTTNKWSINKQVISTNKANQMTKTKTFVKISKKLGFKIKEVVSWIWLDEIVTCCAFAYVHAVELEINPPLRWFPVQNKKVNQEIYLFTPTC